jgi:hypothetical protein
MLALVEILFQLKEAPLCHFDLQLQLDSIRYKLNHNLKFSFFIFILRKVESIQLLWLPK